MKPIWNPFFGPVIDGRNKATAMALKNSSQTGAEIASMDSSIAQFGNDEGINSGATKLLKKNAGKAEAMPAISQDSASLRLVGIPIEEVDEPHHARTGSENPTSQRGIARMRNSAFPSVAVPPKRNNEVSVNPSKTVAAKIVQSCLLGGVSKIESSLIKNLEKIVLVGVCREPPSGKACIVEPFSSGVASLTWIIRGR